MHATDHVLPTTANIVAFVDESMLRDTFKTNGKWHDSAGRMLARLMVKRMQLMSFRERVAAQLHFEGKDESSPIEVQAMVLNIAQKADAEERVRALNLKCVQCIAGDRHQPEKRRSGRTEYQRISPSSEPFKGNRFYCDVFGHRVQASKCPRKSRTDDGTQGEQSKGHRQDGRPQERRKLLQS